MTDKAYQAQLWLMRADELEKQWRSTSERILYIQNKLNGGVANYYGSGKSDRISAQASHEDLLIEYSMLKDRLDKELSMCLHEDNITIRVLDRMTNHFHSSILIARYICRNNWKEIVKMYGKKLSKNQYFNHHNQALEELSVILDSVILEEIPQADKKELDHSLQDLA